MGITQEAMARMEKGKIAPKMSRIPELSARLQCAPAHLFRQHNETAGELAENVAEILKELPQSGQAAVLELVAHVVQVMLRRT